MHDTLNDTDSMQDGDRSIRNPQVCTEDSPQRASARVLTLLLPPLATVMAEWRR